MTDRAKLLIKTKNLTRSFGSDETQVQILKGIDLEIYAGEMVAIIGQSGSGKTTLMNILGCLDSPTSGEYWIDGKNTKELDSQELAELRREHIGFIFQRYYLLADLRARENVAMPAVYAGVDSQTRLDRADEILTRLGLGDRVAYKPTQLSGGQQQRVSIARALMNGGRIIFADEPTGALDSASGKEVMKILRELNQEGHTLILVTHDPNIAASADRIIEIKDGCIISDKSNKARNENPQVPKSALKGNDSFGIKALVSAFFMAISAIMGHKLRAFLTMLGIVIGIASVVSMVALGQGSQQQVLSSISSLGSNTIQIFPGKFGDRRSGRIRTLTADDANILSQLDFIDSATPYVRSSGSLRFDDKDLSASISGVGKQYFQVQNIPVVSGRQFEDEDINQHRAVGFISSTNAKTLFGTKNPLGQVVLLNNVPLTIIGLVDDTNQNAFGGSNNVEVWLPYTSVMSRLMRQNYISNIIVRIKDEIESSLAEDAVKRTLINRHGSEDFTLLNNDSLRETITQATQALSLLISAIAVISLIVGGIGVMNIMLVSVTERTQEIGIRMAVGARQTDIMRQFLIEAILLCLIGGIIGIGLAFSIGFLVSALSDFSMIYSSLSVFVAFTCATAIGLLFGYLPAKNAAKLDPVQALAGE